MKTMLKIELVALLLIPAGVYFYLHYNVWFFLVLLLMPDISMVGYLINPKIGAMLYNAAHTYISPTILLFIYFAIDKKLLLGIALIWFVHISLDRLLGYGLKHPTGFRDTHLGRIGTER